MVYFFSNLIELWNKLGNHVKIPTFKCGITDKTVKMMEENKSHQFLIYGA